MTIDLRAPRVVDVARPEPAVLALLSIDALAAAAARLPSGCVEHHLATDLPHVLPDGRIRRLDEEPEAVVRTVGANGCWVMLRSLAALGEYRAMLHRFAAPLQLAVRVAGEHAVAHDLIAFVAGPRANVPVHCDLNHHLLVQLRGTKTVGVGTYDDPAVFEVQVERGLRAHRLNADRLPDRQERFILGPGQALMLPAFTFHWVEGGDETSVALACVVATRETRERTERFRAEAAHRER
jgi:hypothetical protein